MSARRPPEPDETRAEIARRRLAQLAASFDMTLPPEPDIPPPTRSRRLDAAHVRVVASIVVAGAVLAVWWLLSGRPQTAEPVPLTASSPSVSATPTTGPELVIDVVGKVRRPGIVVVPPGSRVFEAIEAAGGLRGKVDTSTLNMARIVGDGEQILVGIPPAPVVGGPAAGSGAAGPPTAKLDLNVATAEQLDTLPGVGPVTASAILAWRDANGRFASVDDLLEVKGIGDATLAELRDLVTV